MIKYWGTTLLLERLGGEGGGGQGRRGETATGALGIMKRTGESSTTMLSVFPSIICVYLLPLNY